MLNFDTETTTERRHDTLSDSEFFKRVEEGDQLIRERDAKLEREHFIQEMCDLIRPVLAKELQTEIAEVTDKPNQATIQLYQADLRRFKQFCDVGDLPVFPAEPEMIAHFLFQMSEDGSTASVINRCVAAISYAHRIKKLYDPTEDVLVRAAVRSVAKKNKKAA